MPRNPGCTQTRYAKYRETHYNSLSQAHPQAEGFQAMLQVHLLAPSEKIQTTPKFDCDQDSVQVICHTSEDQQEDKYRNMCTIVLVGPHKAVAEVSKIGALWSTNRKGWVVGMFLTMWQLVGVSMFDCHILLIFLMNSRIHPSFFLSIYSFIWQPICLSIHDGYLPVYLSVYFCICRFNYLAANPSFYLLVLSIHLSVCLSICLSIRLAVRLSVYPSIYPSSCPSICLSFYLSIYLSITWSFCQSICLPI